MTCDLCEAAPLTRRYVEGDDYWIADCEICAVPMVVWRTHDPNPPADVRAELAAALTSVGVEVFGDRPFVIDDHMRNIPDHYHAHARPRPVW